MSLVRVINYTAGILESGLGLGVGVVLLLIHWLGPELGIRLDVFYGSRPSASPIPGNYSILGYKYSGIHALFWPLCRDNPHSLSALELLLPWVRLALAVSVPWFSLCPSLALASIVLVQIPTLTRYILISFYENITFFCG